MQEDIRKKVFLDVFVSKSTLLPVVAGGTVSLLAIAADQWALAFGGAAGVVAGIGICLTRFIFNLESVTENAFNYLQEKKQKEAEDALDKLEKELIEDDRNSLQMLRNAYKHHKDQIKKGDIIANDELEEKLEKLFQGCQEQLKYASALYVAAQTLKKDAKKGVLDNRQKILGEVNDSIQCFNKIVEGITAINAEKVNKSLSELRGEAASSFEVVKRTEARVAELGKQE